MESSHGALMLHKLVPQGIHGEPCVVERPMVGLEPTCMGCQIHRHRPCSKDVLDGDQSLSDAGDGVPLMLPRDGVMMAAMNTESSAEGQGNLRSGELPGLPGRRSWPDGGGVIVPAAAAMAWANGLGQRSRGPRKGPRLRYHGQN